MRSTSCIAARASRSTSPDARAAIAAAGRAAHGGAARLEPEAHHRAGARRARRGSPPTWPSARRRNRDRCARSPAPRTGRRRAQRCRDAAPRTGRDAWVLAELDAFEHAPRADTARRRANPDSTADVSRALGSVPLAAASPSFRSARGSGVCGGIAPRRRSVALSTRRLDGLRRLDSEDLIAVFGAGTMGIDAERALERARTHARSLAAVDRASRRSAAGSRRARRASSRPRTAASRISLLALEVVLADGAVLRTRETPRAAAGPDLRQLFLGSEGTLGVVTEVTFSVRARAGVTRRQAFHFDGFRAGLEAIRRALRAGLRPPVARLYDARESRRNFRDFVPRRSLHCCCCCTRARRASSTPRSEALARLCREAGGVADRRGGAVDQWLGHRNRVPSFRSFLEQGVVVDTIEVAATWSRVDALYHGVVEALSRVPGVLSATRALESQLPIRAPACTSRSPRSPTTRRGCATSTPRAGARAMEATLAAGGGIAHHHGIGRVRRPWLGAEDRRHGRHRLACAEARARSRRPAEPRQPAAVADAMAEQRPRARSRYHRRARARRRRRRRDPRARLAAAGVALSAARLARAGSRRVLDAQRRSRCARRSPTRSSAARPRGHRRRHAARDGARLGRAQRRSARAGDRLAGSADGIARGRSRRPGIPVSTLTSGTKFEWLLRYERGRRSARRARAACASERPTSGSPTASRGGAVFATDPSEACCTGLYDLRERRHGARAGARALRDRPRLAARAGRDERDRRRDAARLARRERAGRRARGRSAGRHLRAGRRRAPARRSSRSALRPCSIVHTGETPALRSARRVPARALVARTGTRAFCLEGTVITAGSGDRLARRCSGLLASASDLDRVAARAPTPAASSACPRCRASARRTSMTARAAILLGLTRGSRPSTSSAR